MSRPFAAVPSAMARTRAVLFEPFDGGKYVAIGFSIWLCRLGDLGAGTSELATKRRWDSLAARGHDVAETWRQVVERIVEWGWLIVPVVAAASVMGLSVWAALTFVQSRGAFLAVDNLVQNRGRVREPWAEWAPQANALFRFRLLLAVAYATVLLTTTAAAVLGVSATGAWWAVTPTHFAIVAMAVVVALLAGLATAVADGSANEFVVPLMYARRYGVSDGFRDLWGFVRGDFGGFVLYLVMRMAIGIAMGMVSTLLVCFTCGLVLVPFLGTLILLPLLLFVRAFSVAFVGQLSEDLAVALGIPPSG